MTKKVDFIRANDKTIADHEDQFCSGCTKRLIQDGFVRNCLLLVASRYLVIDKMENVEIRDFPVVCSLPCAEDICGPRFRYLQCSSVELEKLRSAVRNPDSDQHGVIVGLEHDVAITLHGPTR